MKKALFLVLPLITSVAMYAQQIDKKVEAEYAAAYNSLSENAKEDIENERGYEKGVLLFLDFSVDTLNKDKYLPKLARKPNTNNPGKPSVKYHNFLITSLDTWTDFAQYRASTPSRLFMGKFYDKGVAFFAFELKYVAGKLASSYFDESSTDSTVKRYRKDASSADLDKISVPLMVEKY
jgi:hypothetical protein